MRNSVFLMIAAISFIMGPTAAHGQEASIKAELSVDTVQAGHPFKLRVTIDNHRGRYFPPNLSDFQLVGGPSQSSQMSIINGVMRQSEQYTYMLIAKDPGTYRLGKASSEGENGSISTPEIEITVIPSQDNGMEGPDSWHELGKGGSPDKPEVKLKKRKF